MIGSGHDIDRPRPSVTCPSLDAVITILMHSTFVVYTFVIWRGELILLPSDETDWCWSAQNGYPNIKTYDNPDYNNNPCYKERPPQLLGMSQMEISFARRMFTAVLLGAAIGFERKASDRPAGIRTMSLVCLGASFFTYCGQLAFRSSTMGFDAARVSAAVPSGVGFLGAGLIWKGTVGLKGTPDERHEVHGLTTAASVWLSAAVGVGVGGKLYVISLYAVALVILVLRLGPRLYFQDDASSYCDEEEYDDDISTEDDFFESSETYESMGITANDFTARSSALSRSSSCPNLQRRRDWHVDDSWDAHSRRKREVNLAKSMSPSKHRGL